MAITDRIKSIFRRRGGDIDEFDKAAAWRNLQTKRAPYLWPDYEVGRVQWHITDIQAFYEQGFNANDLVYGAIMYKASAYGSVPLRAYKGDPDNPDPLPMSHPLAKLCMRPNPSQSWQEFQMLQTVYVNLAGNSYGYLDRQNSERGVPSEVSPLDPRRVFIIPKNRRKLGYIYIPEGEGPQSGEPMLPKDVMHVKFPLPGDRLEGQGYGLSPLSPAARSIDIDNAVTRFLQMFFERGAVVPGLLSFDVALSNEQVAKIRERWTEIYGGSENWYKIGVLDQSGTYKRVALTFDEMGFEAIDNRTCAKILTTLRVPPILVGSQLGIEHSTYSNYEQAREAFWTDVALPELGLFEGDYRYYLQSEDGGFVAFDTSKVIALARLRAQATESFGKLVAGGITKNDAARMTDLSIPSYPDGDTIYMPMNLVPVGQAGEEPVEQPKPEPKPSAQGMAEAEEEADEEESERQTRALENLAQELKAAREALEREDKDVGDKKENDEAGDSGIPQAMGEVGAITAVEE